MRSPGITFYVEKWGHSLKNFPESWTADMHEEALCQICRVLGDRVCTVQIQGARHVDIVLGRRVIICGLRKQTRLPHRCLMQRKLDNARKRKPSSNSCAFNVTVWSLTSGDWNDEAFLRYSILFLPRCQSATSIIQNGLQDLGIGQLVPACVWDKVFADHSWPSSPLKLPPDETAKERKVPRKCRCKRPGHLYLGHQPWSCRQHLDDGSDADKNDF